jgi:hypothetical protein
MKDLILGLLVLACMAFAFGVEYVAYTAKSHAVSTDALAGGALFMAIGLALPMRLAGIVNTARRVLPWADRRSVPRPAEQANLPDAKP